MNVDILFGVIQIILIATTPLVFAAIGELVTEKTGVLNLGVEGMMLVGAVSAFVTLVVTGSYVLAFLVSILSGILMSGLFAYLVLILMSNQVATGLALTIFGIGLSSMIGKQYIGTPITGLNPYFFVALSFVIVDLSKRKVTEFEEEKLKLMKDFIEENKSKFSNEGLLFSSKLKK